MIHNKKLKENSENFMPMEEDKEHEEANTGKQHITDKETNRFST